MGLPAPIDVVAYWTISRSRDGVFRLREWVADDGVPRLNHETTADGLDQLHELLPGGADRLAGPPSLWPPEDDVQEVLLEVWRPTPA